MRVDGHSLDPPTARPNDNLLVTLDIPMQEIEIATTLVDRLRCTKAHPDVPIYTAAVDRQLDERGYICPAWETLATASSGTN